MNGTRQSTVAIHRIKIEKGVNMEILRYNGGEDRPEIIGGIVRWPNAKIPRLTKEELAAQEERLKSLYPNYQPIKPRDEGEKL
jgi:hypothetical protein